MKLNGCADNCGETVHHLQAVNVLSYHYYFTKLPKSAKRQWILDYFHTHSSNNETTYIISGKTVCQKVWIATLGISSTSFYSIRKLFTSGTVRVFATPNRKPLQKTHEALAWMQQYFSLIGDHMPHRMMIHLPSCLSKVSVYKRMVSDFQARQKGQFVSKSQFFLLWENHFNHVTIPAVSLLPAQCSCIDF
jgi:hypothetical protein